VQYFIQPFTLKYFRLCIWTLVSSWHGPKQVCLQQSRPSWCVNLLCSKLYTFAIKSDRVLLIQRGMGHGQFECSTVDDLGKRCNYMELHAADKKYLWIRSNWLAVSSDKIYPALVLTAVCLFYNVPFVLCFTFMCSLSAVLKEIKWMLNNFLHQGRWPEGAAVHASCLLFTEEKNRIDSFNLVSSLLNFSVAQHKIPQLKIQNYPWKHELSMKHVQTAKKN